MKPITATLSLLAAAIFFSACGKSGDHGHAHTAPPPPVPPAEVDPQIAAVIVDTEPAGAVTVSELRKTAVPGDSVTLVGKIAGHRKPFTEGFATAIVSDLALETCDLIPGDNCPTPWDACCVAREEIAASRLTIQVLGDDGRPVAQSLRGINGLAELDPVVVTGTVDTGSTGENLLINVTALHRRGK